MEELFLKPLIALHELNVVNQQDINFAITAFKGSNGVAANAIYIFVQERLGRDISHLVMGVVLVNVVTNCVEEVGLSETSRTVNK